MFPRSHRAAPLFLVLALVVSGCGKKGPPQPPEPRGPLPPTSVEARQIGETVHVAFLVPPPRGEKVAQQPVRAELIRVAYGPGISPPPDANAFRRRGVIVGSLVADPLASGDRLSLLDETVTRLDGRGVGWLFRYGIRVRDRRERPSPLVVARDLVLAEPIPAPGAPRAEATADGVRLSWEVVPGREEARFNVYRHDADASPPERPLNTVPLGVTELLDGDVVVGETYVYRIRATETTSPPFRESESSPETRIVAEDRFAPGRPSGLVAVQERLGVRLFWNPNEERDLAGYRVYRRAGEDEEWSRVGPDSVREPLFLDKAVTAGQEMFYRVTAVDRTSPPNESDPSEAVRVLLAVEPGGAPVAPEPETEEP